MPLPDELVARIERSLTLYGAGRPLPAAEIRERLSAIGLLPDEDYVEFVSRWGGCFVGVPVHGWGNASLLGSETCVDLTMRCRADYGDLVDGLVIADDGAGNPIWISPSGPVRLIDHDNGFEVVQLADSFRALLDDNVPS